MTPQQQAEAAAKEYALKVWPDYGPASINNLQSQSDFKAGANWMRLQLAALEAKQPEQGQTTLPLSAEKEAAVAKERDALQCFKDFVHRRLDEMGIPTHPDGEHSKAGCRIGDRLDIAQAIIEHEARMVTATKELLPAVEQYLVHLRRTKRFMSGNIKLDIALDTVREAIIALHDPAIER